MAARRISSHRSRSLFDAGPSVPSPTRIPTVEEFRDRGDPRGQLGVGLRAVGDGHVVVDVDVDVLGRQPDAVGGQHPPVEHARPRPAPPGPSRRARPRTRPPRPRLGQVQVEQGVAVRGRPPPCRPGRAVAPCRRHGRRTRPRSARPRRRAGRGSRRTGRGWPSTSRPPTPPRELQDPRGHHGPRSRRPRTASAMASSWKYISQVVVTPKASSSAAARRHPPEDVPGLEVGLAGPQHLVQPPQQRQVLPGAPEQGHGRVAVGVDEAGQERTVDPDLSDPCGPGRRGTRRSSHPDHRVPRHLDRARPQDRRPARRTGRRRRPRSARCPVRARGRSRQQV